MRKEVSCQVKSSQLYLHNTSHTLGRLNVLHIESALI